MRASELGLLVWVLGCGSSPGGADGGRRSDAELVADADALDATAGEDGGPPIEPVFETIADEASLGVRLFTSVAIATAPDGSPRVAFAASAGGAGARAGLYFAEPDGSGGWTTTDLGIEVNELHSLSVTSDGAAHVVYEPDVPSPLPMTPVPIGYARSDSGWSPIDVPVPAGADRIDVARLAAGPSGTLHLALVATTGVERTLHYGAWTGSSFDVELAGTDAPLAIDLAVAEDGTVHIVAGGSGSFAHVTGRAGAFTTDVEDTAGANLAIAIPLALGTAGEPNLAGVGAKGRGLYHLALAGGTWSETQLLPPEGVGRGFEFPLIGVDSGGRVHVAVATPGTSQGRGLALVRPSASPARTEVSIGTNLGQFDMAVASSAHLLLVDRETTSSPNRLRYARF